MSILAIFIGLLCQSAAEQEVHENLGDVRDLFADTVGGLDVKIPEQIEALTCTMISWMRADAISDSLCGAIYEKFQHPTHELVLEKQDCKDLFLFSWAAVEDALSCPQNENDDIVLNMTDVIQEYKSFSCELVNNNMPYISDFTCSVGLFWQAYVSVEDCSDLVSALWSVAYGQCTGQETSFDIVTEAWEQMTCGLLRWSFDTLLEAPLTKLTNTVTSICQAASKRVSMIDSDVCEAFFERMLDKAVPAKCAATTTGTTTTASQPSGAFLV